MSVSARAGPQYERSRTRRRVTFYAARTTGTRRHVSSEFPTIGRVRIVFVHGFFPLDFELEHIVSTLRPSVSYIISIALEEVTARSYRYTVARPLKYTQ